MNVEDLAGLAARSLDIDKSTLGYGDNDDSIGDAVYISA